MTTWTSKRIETEILGIMAQGAAAIKQVVDAYREQRTPERDVHWLSLQMAKEYAAIALHIDHSKMSIGAGIDGRGMEKHAETVKEELDHFRSYKNLLDQTIGKDAEIPVADIYRYFLADVGPNGVQMNEAMHKGKDKWPENYAFIARFFELLNTLPSWSAQVISAQGEGGAAGWHWAMSLLPADDAFLEMAARIERTVSEDELHHGPEEIRRLAKTYDPEQSIPLEELFQIMRELRYMEVRERNEQFLHPLTEEQMEVIRVSIMDGSLEPADLYDKVA